MNPNSTGHKKVKTVFKVLGPIFIIAGLGGVIYSIVNLVNFSDFGLGSSMTKVSNNGLSLFLSFIALGIGVFLTTAGFRREIIRYEANEIAPVVKDVANYMLDGTRVELNKTLNRNQEVNNKNIVCFNCHKLTDADSVFCENCGTMVKKVCGHCGEKIDGDAKFCKNCGKKIG